MPYTEAELTKLIDEVSVEFGTWLAKSENIEATVLAKSEDEKEKEDKKDEPKDEAPKAEGKEGEEKPESHEDKGEEKPEHHEEEKPEHKEEAAPEEKHEEPKHEGEEGHDYDEKDMEHMHNMYRSMSKGELKAHHDAVRQALDHHGMQKCGDMSSPAPMAKSEVIEVPETIQSKEVELVKSELAAEKAKFEELKKNFDAVAEFLTKLTAKKTAPQGKAITSMEYIAKSEAIIEEKPLTKSEITAILSKKAQDPSLSKADREAINAYYLENKNEKSISHLLK